jgi:hypothetical protein
MPVHELAEHACVTSSRAFHATLLRQSRWVQSTLFHGRCGVIISAAMRSRLVIAGALTTRAVVQRLMNERVAVKAEAPPAVWAAQHHPHLHASKPRQPAVHCTCSPFFAHADSPIPPLGRRPHRQTQRAPDPSGTHSSATSQRAHAPPPAYLHRRTRGRRSPVHMHACTTKPEGTAVVSKAATSARYCTIKSKEVPESRLIRQP